MTVSLLKKEQYRKLAIAAITATFTAFVSSVLAYLHGYGKAYIGYAIFWLLMFLLDIYLLRHPPRPGKKSICSRIEELARIIAGLEDKYSLARKASRLIEEGVLDDIKNVCGDEVASLLDKLLAGDESIREKLVESLDNCFASHCVEEK